MSLTQRDLQIALRCVSELLDMRKLRGTPIPDWLSEHAHRIEAAYLTTCLSEVGPEFDCGEPQLADDRISAAQAAARLRMTSRNVRRQHAELDGRKIGTIWTFSRQAVEEYAEARQRN